MYGLFLVCVMLTRVTYTEYRGRHLGADRGQPLASGGVHAESSERRGIGNSGAKRYLYAAFNDGSIHVYDIDEDTEKAHTPSDLVVAHWTSDVESTVPLDVMLRHDLWTPFWCLMSCK